MDSTPRTKEDIIGFSDPEDSESDAESIDVQPNMKLLPATLEGLLKHFHELYTEFRRQGKHEHRNELVLLLNELLLQQGIDREECTILNNILAKSLGSGIADEEEDGDDEEEESANIEDDSVEDDKTEDKDKSPDEKIKTIIQSTVEYLIQHDKKELLELVNGFRKDVGGDFLDTVLEFEELVDVYLLKEFLKKEPIRIKIEEHWKVQLLSPNLSNID